MKKEETLKELIIFQIEEISLYNKEGNRAAVDILSNELWELVNESNISEL